MLPDWIPNIHPLVVHFPIALLVIAVLFDITRLLFKKQDWLHNTIVALYAIGTVGLIAAFISGRQAVNTVSVTGEAIPVVTTHEDWALYTMIFFTLFTLLRLWSWWKEFDEGWVRPALIIPALIGIGMLWHTGELGAQLVFKHGVGVSEIDRLNRQIDEQGQLLAGFREEAGPEIRDDGSWVWRIGAGADQVVSESFTIVGTEDINTMTGVEEGRSHLEIIAPDDLVFLYTGGNMSAVDGRVEVNLSDFDGNFLLIHHYTDRENYQYLRISGSELQQGQMLNGSDNLLGSGRFNTDGWSSLRVTASGRHYYGFQNGNTILHTHAEEMGAGKTGFAFSGSGSVKMRLIEFSLP